MVKVGFGNSQWLYERIEFTRTAMIKELVVLILAMLVEPASAAKWFSLAKPNGYRSGTRP